MSFLLHSKHARKEVEKMIKEHVDKMRRTYSWSGEHKEITKEIGIDKVIYEGWMFASTPSLRSLEHPVYDVWLLRCKKNIN